MVGLDETPAYGKRSSARASNLTPEAGVAGDEAEAEGREGSRSRANETPVFRANDPRMGVLALDFVSRRPASEDAPDISGGRASARKQNRDGTDSAR